MQTKILLGLGLTLFIVVFIAVYWATESGRQEAARERQITEAAERGAELYAVQCASCHGSGGEGRVGPALKDSPLEQAVLEKTISRGIAGTAMPAFGTEDGGPLKHHEILDLITFIKNWGALPPAPEALPKSTSPQPVGDELYAAKCAGCHGPNREGIDGLAPPLTPESLSTLSDADVRQTILDGVPGSVMPSWRSTLTDEQVEALLQFIKHAP